MQKTMSSRRRARVTAGPLGLGLVILVGCAGTIDGRASAAKELGSIGNPTSWAASDTPTTDDPSSESADSTTDPTTASSADTTSGTSSGSSPATSTTTTDSSTSSASPSTGSTGADPTFTGNPDDLGLTAPGTALAFGAPATLPFAYADAEGVFTLSGLTVTRGSEADWAALGVDTSDAQGEEPWYIRLTLTQDSGGDFSSLGLQDNLWAYTSDDDGLDVIYPQDDANPLCPTTVAPDDFGPGQSYDACVVLSVNLGESVDRVQYEGGYELDDPYYENPVVWKG